MVGYRYTEVLAFSVQNIKITVDSWELLWQGRDPAFCLMPVHLLNSLWLLADAVEQIAYPAERRGDPHLNPILNPSSIVAATFLLTHAGCGLVCYCKLVTWCRLVGWDLSGSWDAWPEGYVLQQSQYGSIGVARAIISGMVVLQAECVACYRADPSECLVVKPILCV